MSPLLTVLLVVTALVQMRWSAEIVRISFQPSWYPKIPADPDFTTLKIGKPSAELAQAGVVEGARLIACDGLAVISVVGFREYVLNRRPGTEVLLRFENPGRAVVEVRAPLVPFKTEPDPPGDLLIDFAAGIFTPLFCIGLGGFVFVRRRRDPIAWALLVLMLAISQVAVTNGDLRPVLGIWWTVPIYFLTGGCAGLAAPAWLWFCLLFPDPASGRRVLPWSGWVFGIPLALYALGSGVLNAVGAHAPLSSALVFDLWSKIPHAAVPWMLVAAYLLGLVNLFIKQRFETQPAQRRKLRLVLAGLGLSFTPLILVLLANFAGLVRLGELGLLFPVSILMLGLAPVTLAYTVLVQKTIDVGVAVRQGLRYAFAARSVAVIRTLLLGALVWIALSIGRAGGSGIGSRLVIIGILLAAAALISRAGEWLSGWVDQRFFREAVDAERVLISLNDEVHRMVDPGQLLDTVVRRVAEALHVSHAAALLDSGGMLEPAFAFGYAAPPEGLPASHPVASSLRAHAGALRVEEPEARGLTLAPEILLPIGTAGSFLGAIVLGPKRSEEPYSAGDLRLLESVAPQAGLALENSRLAAQRERIQSEIDLAQQVQQRLLPLRPPVVPGLELAGYCRPAQSVGGDYFDYFLAGSGEVVLAVGDVAGKGIPAALLMASLQSSLRGLTVAGIFALDDLMAKLNRLIYDATPVNRFATFWVGFYHPETRTLRYATAGHSPALVCGAGGVGWLRAPGVGLGLTRSARYEERSIALAAGDTLILYTDGITEARNAQGEEFGEDRLTAAAASKGRPEELVARIVAAVDAFAAGAPQHDDLTLVIATLSLD
ncbi:MAG: hypothetical protein FJW40_26305 [Acidobacteria bacterium]|nr:hypothetical protein [Acidobacteriota bacterium]